MGSAPKKCPCEVQRKGRPSGTTWIAPWIVLPLLILGIACTSAPAPRTKALPQTPQAPRTLVIALDAIPYSVIARVTDPSRKERAIFRELRGPVPLISTFPSTTSLAFAGLLEPFGLAKSPGYEARFFDRTRNRVQSGRLINYHQVHFPWREFWDFKTWTLKKKLASGIRPRTASLRSIERSLAAFMASDQQFFFAYFDATDLLAHLRGPDALDEVLIELDRALTELHRRHPDQPFATVLFSDHGIAGGPPLKNVRLPIRQALRQAGFHAADRLRQPQDVVFTPFGLVSSLVVATQPGHEAQVARVIAGVPGVDLCAAPLAREGSPPGLRIESARGSATVFRRVDPSSAAIEWSYQAESGDPVGLAAHFGRDAWSSDRAVFDASLNTRYPDSLHRLSRSFDLVLNPASVVCSLADGYMYGALMTEVASWLSVGRLRWTHGALDRETSLGFLMSDVPGWEPPAATRFDEALRPFASRFREQGWQPHAHP